MPAEFLSVLLPLMLTAAGALACLVCEPYLRDEAKHRILPWIAVLALLGAALAQVLRQPAGLEVLHGLLAIDPARRWLSLGVVACAAIAVAGMGAALRRDRFPGGEVYCLLLLAACGAQVAVMATDLMALFVGLELTALAIFPAIGLRRHRAESSEALYKYLVSNAIFSALLLYGIALHYGATGDTTYGAAVLDGRQDLWRLSQALLMIGLLFKVGAVPFHFWSPDVYTGAPVAVTGFLAAVGKIAGFSALGALWLHQIALGQGRTGALALDGVLILDAVPGGGVHAAAQVLVGLAVLSVLLGTCSALGQGSLRRMMAFSSIAHAGYMLLALALPGAPGAGFGLGALWYYLLGYALASAGLMTALAAACGPEDADRIDDLGGLGRRQPLLGVMATLLLASLAGLPPTAGFLGKYLVLAELVGKGQILMAVMAIVLAVVGAAFYLRLAVVLWSQSPAETDAESPQGATGGVLVPVLVGLAAALILALLLVPTLIAGGAP